MAKHDEPDRILVCGGRDFNDQKFLFETMDTLRQWFSMGFCIIHGGAAGADYLAGKWAQSIGAPTIIVPANWDFYENQAGGIRNFWMLHYCKPDLCIGFKGGSGTADMIKRCKKAGIPTYEPI